jgi:thiamine transporter 2/3
MVNFRLQCVGAAFAFLLGYVHVNWSLLGEPLLFLTSAAGGAVLIAMASTDAILVAYVGYVTFRALYQTMITVASFEVARNLPSDSYGLVFGFNTFMALAFQSVLTLVVADDLGLALEPRTQVRAKLNQFELALCMASFVSSSWYTAGTGAAWARSSSPPSWAECATAKARWPSTRACARKAFG